MPEQSISGSICGTCSRVIVPPRDTCPYCGKKAGLMEQIKLASRGTVQSYTTLQKPPNGFKAPLSMALVKLEYGALILCLASEQTEEHVSIGDEVEIEIDSEGRFCYRVIK